MILICAQHKRRREASKDKNQEIEYLKSITTVVAGRRFDYREKLVPLEQKLQLTDLLDGIT